MRLRPPQRGLVVFSSSVDPAGRYAARQPERRARRGRIRRLLRIGMLLTVIAVRPRWRPLLAGIALTALGVVARHGGGGIFVIPGMLLLWHAMLIPADTDSDRERLSQLRRELESYSTPAQRCDLDATLDRYPDGMTSEIRDLLARQAAPSRGNGIPGAARY
jgi:hypothetical protein